MAVFSPVHQDPTKAFRDTGETLIAAMQLQHQPLVPLGSPSVCLVLGKGVEPPLA